MSTATIPFYSHLFSCLHDEPEPILGNIGNVMHHSVFRSVDRINAGYSPSQNHRIHDFAVIWDSDHDTRVIKAAEKMQLASLLSPVLFIGERKGTLTVIVSSQFADQNNLPEYRQRIAEVAQWIDDDSWTITVGNFNQQDDHDEKCSTAGIIATSEYNARAYLRYIDFMWRLGVKDFGA